MKYVCPCGEELSDENPDTVFWVAPVHELEVMQPLDYLAIVKCSDALLKCGHCERWIVFDSNNDELTRPRMLTRLELIDLAREAELSRMETEQKLLESERKNAEYQAQPQEQAPKVLFAEAVTTSPNTILIRELAVILKQNGIEIGQNRLFEELRDRGYLVKRHGSDRNMPTQRSMELGLFEVKETPILHSDGRVTVSKTPKVTGKKQVYFVNLFQREMTLQLQF